MEDISRPYEFYWKTSQIRGNVKNATSKNPNTSRDIPLVFLSDPPPSLLRTTVVVHNWSPQENINVYKSCKNQHVPLIIRMCCAHSNDKTIDYLHPKINENRGKVHS